MGKEEARGKSNGGEREGLEKVRKERKTGKALKREKNLPATRFSMVKERHASTLEKAGSEGKLDSAMASLCSHIAKTRDYFTSSGCSGRILLLGLVDRTKKNSYFHRKWHEEVRPDEVMKALKEETRGEVWLKMEPFIIHIGTNSLENARKLLALKDRSGIKRGGIIAARPGKFIVELIGTDELSVLVKKEGRVLAPGKFIREIVLEANRKMERNSERVKRFEEIVGEELK